MAILILDDDLGFAMWLGQVLTEAGMTAFPASTGAEALSLIDAPGFPPIELVIANFDLNASRNVIEAVAARGGKFRIIALGNLGTAGRRKIHTRIERPGGKAAPSPSHYLNLIRTIL